MEETGINTDKALFERIATGDEAAFSILFFRYTARLAPFVTRLLQSDSWSEEIVQDVFMRLWQSRLQLGTIEHPQAYLYQMASNRTLDYIKRNAREVKLQYYAARWVTAAADHPDAEQDFREIDNLLKEAVGQLPAQRRKVYQLVREEGLSHAEIADRLGISKHTVRNHVAEALQEIRLYLREHGVMIVFLLGLVEK
ncbi:MAG TPA: RNA polymerase sigma-70 factor [Puia sp.]|nr:RNA polymerase sigma-70 factor [Puia sp.]